MPTDNAPMERHMIGGASLSRTTFARPSRYLIPQHERGPTRSRQRQASNLAHDAATSRGTFGLLRKLLAWREAAVSRVAELTAREHEIMGLVLAGQPSKNIAADLGISQRTVENHRASIMKKTGSKSLAALAQLIFVADWIDTPDLGPVAEPAFLQRDGV